MHYYYSLDAAQSDTSVRLAIDRLWRLDPPPTALICFDPFAASHAGEALRRRGLRCPADVSIIARECVNPGPPSFTTLVSDPHQMGAAAANQLVERLTNVGSMPRKLQFSSALVAGPSTGPSPRAQQLA
jgi:DNA-binding LacI/PurR family transcriptional regulator